MMTERYFIKFPNTVYANTECKNITLRPVLSDKLDSTPSLFYKYSLKTGARADMISSNYYDDPYYEWLIYLNNKIIDPYYGWYLGDYEFEQFIKKKYGSIEQAQKKIYYYQLNWTNDDNEITPSFYNSTLPYVLRKYYTPIFGASDKIIAYRRRESEVLTNTNKLLHFDITTISGNGYTVGEIIDIQNIQMSEVIGGAEIVFANTTTIKVKNISGNTSAGIYTSFNTNTGVNSSTDYITTTTNHKLSNGDIVQYLTTGSNTVDGLTNGSFYYVKYANSTTGLALSSTVNGANINLTGITSSELHILDKRNIIIGEVSNTIAKINNTDILYENLTDEEAVYWAPVYFYEYEVDKNEANRNLRLLHNNYALEAAEELRTILKE